MATLYGDRCYSSNYLRAYTRVYRSPSPSSPKLGFCSSARPPSHSDVLKSGPETSAKLKKVTEETQKLHIDSSDSSPRVSLPSDLKTRISSSLEEVRKSRTGTVTLEVTADEIEVLLEERNRGEKTFRINWNAQANIAIISAPLIVHDAMPSIFGPYFQKPEDLEKKPEEKRNKHDPYDWCIFLTSPTYELTRGALRGCKREPDFAILNLLFGDRVSYRFIPTTLFEAAVSQLRMDANVKAVGWIGGLPGVRLVIVITIDIIPGTFTIHRLVIDMWRQVSSCKMEQKGRTVDVEKAFKKTPREGTVQPTSSKYYDKAAMKQITPDKEAAATWLYKTDDDVIVIKPVKTITIVEEGKERREGLEDTLVITYDDVDIVPPPEADGSDSVLPFIKLTGDVLLSRTQTAVRLMKEMEEAKNKANSGGEDGSDQPKTREQQYRSEESYLKRSRDHYDVSETFFEDEELHPSKKLRGSDETNADVSE